MVNDLLQILLSERPLFITSEGYRLLAMMLLPYIKHGVKPEAETILHGHMQAQVAATPFLTEDYLDPDQPHDSIAVHLVCGFITAESKWYFSSKQLEKDLLDAEANPSISAHLLYINSGGGEAYYLDRLSETLRSLKKPVFTLCEQTMGSAAYYIGCHGCRVYATTQNDFVGSIGVMTSFHDFEPYFEQMGIKLIEAKATQSDLKNKMANDLLAGRPEQYIHDVLDPLCEQFLSEVCSQRKRLADLDRDHPVLRGEIYLGQRAEELGLIDGIRTLPETVEEIQNYVRQQRELNTILDSI